MQGKFGFFAAAGAIFMALTSGVMAQDKAIPLKVGTLKQGSLTNVWAAKQAGIFAKNGLDVELIEVGIDETPVWTRRSPENSTRPIRLMWHNWEFTVPLTEDLIDPAPPVDEFVINHLSGKPVLLWGRRIRRDKRLKAG